MMSDRIRLYDVEQSAIDDLIERVNYLVEENGITDLTTIDDEYHNEMCDLVFEIADSNVPIYTSDLMQLAADNIHLATDEPELGAAFDGSPTPVNIVAANVFEYIESVLWDFVRDDLENDSRVSRVGSKALPAKYMIEPEYPIEPLTWSAWCETTDDDAGSQFESPESYWEAFEFCVQHAIDNDYKSIVIEWKVTDRDVEQWNKFRADLLVKKQHNRNMEG